MHHAARKPGFIPHGVRAESALNVRHSGKDHKSVNSGNGTKCPCIPCGPIISAPVRCYYRGLHKRTPSYRGVADVVESGEEDASRR